MSGNTLSQEKFFGGKNELQMLPLEIMEENNLTETSKEEYPDFGFTDSIDTRLDKFFKKERKRVLKERGATHNVCTVTPTSKASENEVIRQRMYWSETGAAHFEAVVELIPIFIDNEIVNEEIRKQVNDPDFVEVYNEVSQEIEIFEKETQVKGRNRLFPSKISLKNFWDGGLKSPEGCKHIKKLQNAFSKNSKRKGRMRINEWRQNHFEFNLLRIPYFHGKKFNPLAIKS